MSEILSCLSYEVLWEIYEEVKVVEKLFLCGWKETKQLVKFYSSFSDETFRVLCGFLKGTILINDEILYCYIKSFCLCN